MSIRVRFAPSPTGLLHVGNVRTALFNWLLARKSGGTFVLRIEDTDLVRSETRFETQLLDDLRWIGLDWDEGVEKGGKFGPYRQTERFPIYGQLVRRLLDDGTAYFCFCSQEQLEEDRRAQESVGATIRYVGRCKQLSPDRSAARVEAGEAATVRLDVRPGRIQFHDLVFGDIEIDTATIGDFILLRSDGSAQYNLACVADDSLMNISHVVRGEGHLSNTPRQILIYESLGWDVPRFAHLSTILGPDGTKLSKRHGATSISEFRDAGYLPIALINYLSLLGWSPAEGTPEIMTLEELIADFDLARVQVSPATFDPDKLNWVNRTHLRSLETRQLVQLSIPFLESSGFLPDPTEGEGFRWLEALAPLLINYVDKLEELPRRASEFLSFDPEVDLRNPEVHELMSTPESRRVIEVLAKQVARRDQQKLDADAYRDLVLQVKQETGVKGRTLFHPIRVAITGRASGPELDRLVPILEAGAELKFRRRIPGVRERISAVCRLLSEGSPGDD